MSGEGRAQAIMVRTGLRTTVEASGQPPALRVSWIEWDSGFRGSGLKVGDRIVAVEGVTFDPKAGQLDRAVGQSQESARWAERRAGEGDRIGLTVRRRRLPGEGWETQEVEGRLYPERSYRNAEGRSVMGPGGPQRLGRDEFADSWAAWHERRTFEWERELDGGVWAGTSDSRMALADHLQAEPRVRYLAAHYPGPFAAAMLEDWTAVRDLLQGRKHQVEPEEYAYRDAEDRIVAEVTAAARAAWDTYIAANTADIIPAPPKVNLADGDASKYAGKLVVLPPASPDDWIANSGITLISWRENGGWIFAQLEAPALDLLWRAQLRYKRNVSPTMADVFSVVGRIKADPRMAVPTGEPAIVGVEIEPVAALMGTDDMLMFVEMAAAKDGVAEFAGEAAVRVLPSGPPPDDASPKQVLEAAIQALYARDVETWFRLFADWESFAEDGYIWYTSFDPYPEMHRDSDWSKARRVVLEQTYAVRVVWVGDVRRLEKTDPTLDLPVFEKVDAELDHVGLFDGEYRAFNSVDVHRRWRLERRNGGPWRITTHQGI